MGDDKAALLAGLHELPSICQTIGKLEMAMRRCRRTDSPKYLEYDRRRLELQHQQADISSALSLYIQTGVNIM